VLLGAALALPTPALAGAPATPISGEKAGATPEFVVSLDAGDSEATVYVSRSSQVESTGKPADVVGSCTPSTPTVQPGTFACRPTVYLHTGTGRLSAGSYFWWLGFTDTDPGVAFPFARLAGPLQLVVPERIPPAGNGLVGTAATVKASGNPRFTVKLRAGASAVVYLSTTRGWNAALQRPKGGVTASCRIGAVRKSSTYTCTVNGRDLVAGTTYSWWALVDDPVAGSWPFGPRRLAYRADTSVTGTSRARA
jgi:hypothetical protein